MSITFTPRGGVVRGEGTFKSISMGLAGWALGLKGNHFSRATLNFSGVIPSWWVFVPPKFRNRCVDKSQFP